MWTVGLKTSTVFRVPRYRLYTKEDPGLQSGSVNVTVLLFTGFLMVSSKVDNQNDREHLLLWRNMWTFRQLSRLKYSSQEWHYFILFFNNIRLKWEIFFFFTVLRFQHVFPRKLGVLVLRKENVSLFPCEKL